MCAKNFTVNVFLKKRCKILELLQEISKILFILLNLQSRKLTFDHQPQRACKLYLTCKIRSWVAEDI